MHRRRWVGGCGSVCVVRCYVAGGAWSPPPVTQKESKLTSADSQERRVNGARESVPSPNDEAKHHEDQDDGPGHRHHRDDDDRVLLAGDDGGCWGGGDKRAGRERERERRGCSGQGVIP